MRALASSVAGAFVAIALVGCGGGGKSGASSTTTAPPGDPGLAAMVQLQAALRSHDQVALWDLLSAPTRRRLGPTLAAFRRGGAPELERRLRFLAGQRLRGTIVSERITGPFGVVAVRSGGRVFATPLKHEQGQWKLYLGGPTKIRVLGPDPGSAGRVLQVAYEVNGAPEGATAALYLDGVTLQSKEAVARGSATVYSTLATPLAPGLHNAVAFAAAGGAAAAKAWTFRAR